MLLFITCLCAAHAMLTHQFVYLCTADCWFSCGVGSCWPGTRGLLLQSALDHFKGLAEQDFWESEEEGEEGYPASGEEAGCPASGEEEGCPADGEEEGCPADGEEEGIPADGEEEGCPADGEEEYGLRLETEWVCSDV